MAAPERTGGRGSGKLTRVGIFPSRNKPRLSMGVVTTFVQSIRVVLINQWPHLLSKLLLAAAFCHIDVSPPSQWLAHHEQIPCAVAFVGVIVPSDRSRSSSNEYTSSAIISVALILLAFVAPGDGLSVGVESTDIAGRHYRLTPVLILRTRQETRTLRIS